MESMGPVEAFRQLAKRGIQTSGQIESLQHGSEHHSRGYIEEVLQFASIALPNKFPSSQSAARPS